MHIKWAYENKQFFILHGYSHGNNELTSKYIFTDLFFYFVVVYDNRIIPLRMNDDFSSSLKDTSAFSFYFSQ